MTGRLIKRAVLNPNKSTINVGEVLEGKFYDKPKIGSSFKIGNNETSPVVKLLPNNRFQTKNSEYELQLWW